MSDEDWLVDFHLTLAATRDSYDSIRVKTQQFAKCLVKNLLDMLDLRTWAGDSGDGVVVWTVRGGNGNELHWGV
jgi:hypothetical protein